MRIYVSFRVSNYIPFQFDIGIILTVSALLDVCHIRAYSVCSVFLRVTGESLDCCMQTL
jgi:hypothetical protein